MPPAPKPSLSNQEFEDAVEEIAREQTLESVSHEDAEAALRELNLPAEQLDAAVSKVRARQAEERAAKAAKKRKFGYAAAALAAVLTIGVVAYTRSSQTSAGHAAVTATEAVLTESAGELRMSTKLLTAPKGEALGLTCNWRSPQGALLHESTWKTKPINHDAWETHCVMRETPAHVEVEMLVDGRVIAKTSR